MRTAPFDRHVRAPTDIPTGQPVAANGVDILAWIALEHMRDTGGHAGVVCLRSP